MEDYMKLSFNEFLEAIKGSKTKHVDPNWTFTFPDASQLDTIQIYNYLELITKCFDPCMVKLILKSINTYLTNLNNSFGYKEFFGVDAFKLDQFVELIYILESAIENGKSIKQLGKANIPPKKFVDYLQNNDKAKLLIKLHDLLDGAVPKEFAKYVFALRELYYIQIPTTKKKLYDAMRIEFNEIGTDSAMNSYLGETLSNNSKITKQEIEETKKLIENRLNG